MIIRITEPVNRNVGTAKARPASLRPRRFPKHISRMMPAEISTLYVPTTGKTEATAAVPAATCTGYRHDVVDEQGDRADLGDARPEVLPRDHVGTAGPDVDHHDLAVGQHHEHHDEQDHQRHGQDEAERRDPGQRQQRDEDFLGAVRRRRDAIGGEDAQRERLGQPLLAELLVDQWRPQQSAFHRIPEALGEVRPPLENIDGLTHGQGSAPFLLHTLTWTSYHPSDVPETRAVRTGPGRPPDVHLGLEE